MAALATRENKAASRVEDEHMARDPLKDIHNYSGGMTISQVVRFFERQGMPFTKTMIQNYVRIGLLPPPEEKRLYGRGHLTMLALIHSLKPVFSLEEIGALFTMAGGGNETADSLYDGFLTMSGVALKKMATLKIDGNGDRVGQTLLLMAAGATAKKMAQALLQAESLQDS